MLRFWKAYDGHMNLILSEVEEQIMIVDSDESQTVRVRYSPERA